MKILTKRLMSLLLLLICPYQFVYSQAQDLCVNEFHTDVLPTSVTSLLNQSDPVVDQLNECAQLYGLPEDHVKRIGQDNRGFTQALQDHPLLCLTSLMEGLKESVEDLLGLIWDIAKAFSKVASATFWGTFDFLKAAFTGNLAYWFTEASNNASDFAQNFLKAISAVPQAVVSFLEEKSEDWDCRNDKGQVEMACRLTGYIGGDTLVAALTLGSSKLALAPKVAQLVKKITPSKKSQAPKDTDKPLSRGKKLEQLIPLQKRDQRFIVEVDGRGHYSVRYFDREGRAKYFDGSPFYHQIRAHHRQAGIGTHRLKNRQSLAAQGEHFSVDVHPEKFNDLLDFISQKNGKLSMACTKTACDSMKAAGVVLDQPIVPSIDGLYKALLEEASKSSSAVKRVDDNQMTLAQQDALIRKYKTGTNVVKIQFGMTVFSGYFYAPALFGTPMNLIIERMDANTLEHQQ